MTNDDANKLTHGLYVLYWKDPTGGASLASIGMTYDGTRWFAPCNWTSKDNARPMVASTDWSYVDRVVLVADRRPPRPPSEGKAHEQET